MSWQLVQPVSSFICKYWIKALWSSGIRPPTFTDTVSYIKSDRPSVIVQAALDSTDHREKYLR
ncbi:hypothetical protein C8E04_6359 [Rhodococcus globerulus]|nr:hypothetical protein C8E04_6359 [Rhodococcus globerulus]